MDYIREFLYGMCLNPALRGFDYLAELLHLAKSTDILPLNKYGYPIVAKKYGTTCAAVEKDISYLIEDAFNSDGFSLCLKFGATISSEKCCPTNKHFIFHCIDRLSLS